MRPGGTQRGDHHVPRVRLIAPDQGASGASSKMCPPSGGEYSPAMTVTREALYEEVWAEPMVVVAARYEVSGNFLARVCRALNVPHPARGYWAKAKAGKASRQPELPPVTAGYATEWTRGTMPIAVVGPHRIPPAGTRRRRWSRPTWHSLLENATPLFERARTSDSGYLRPLKRALPDIFASKEGLADALALANQLYLELEDCGYCVALATDGALRRRPAVDHHAVPARGDVYIDDRERWAPARLTVVGLGTLALGLSIYELSERIEMRLIRGEWVPVAPQSEQRAGYGRDWTTHKDRPSGRFVVRR